MPRFCILSNALHRGVWRFGLAVCIAVSVTTTTAAAGPPNILFVMSDDHTTQAVGAYGGRLAGLNPTPTIDAIAAEGIRFENALCTNSICTPSRASIMTGQYAHVNGVLTLSEALPPARQHLAREMSAAGYETAVIGKWHLKNRPEAFDHYEVMESQGLYFNPTFWVRDSDEMVPSTGHSTDVVTDKALAWLAGRDERGEDRPFFLKLHYKAPHDFFESAPRYATYLADTFIPEPPSMYGDPDHGSVATRGCGDELRALIGTSVSRRHHRRSYAGAFVAPPFVEGYGAVGPDEREAASAAYQTYLKRYLRCVKGVDDNLARVVAFLKENGLYDNTVVVYTGDQGMWLGEHDYQDKRWAYEASLKMPLVVRGPGVARGVVSNALVENVDFAPTLLDFAYGEAGVDTPGYMQGKSFRAIAASGATPDGWRDAAFYQYWMHFAHHDVPGHLAMRTNRFKLIFFHGRPLVNPRGWGGAFAQRSPPGWELYDLDADPGEHRNVIDDPAYAQNLKRLKARFARLRTEVGADDPERAPDAVTRADMVALEPWLQRYWDDTAENRAEAKAISAEARAAVLDDPAARE